MRPVVEPRRRMRYTGEMRGDKMQPVFHEGIIEVAGDEPICLQHIFECGQCFRWSPSPRGGYTGVAYGRPTRVWMEGDRLFLRGTPAEYQQIWRTYFDLDRSYDALTEGFCCNDFMRRAVDYGRGLRILRQEPWEALASFIVPQCNNIPRIRSILDVFCRLYGEPVELEGETLHTFPAPKRVAALSLADLTPLRAGYRAQYILLAAQSVASGGLDLAALQHMDTEQARAAVQSLRGVGRKVADCFLLFGLHKLDAFPVDTWMKKADAFYQPGGSAAAFGPYAGIAQQYIFYYARGTKLALPSSGD